MNILNECLREAYQNGDMKSVRYLIKAGANRSVLEELRSEENIEKDGDERLFVSYSLVLDSIFVEGGYSLYDFSEDVWVDEYGDRERTMWEFDSDAEAIEKWKEVSERELMENKEAEEPITFISGLVPKLVKYTHVEVYYSEYDDWDLDSDKSFKTVLRDVDDFENLDQYRVEDEEEEDEDY